MPCAFFYRIFAVFVASALLHSIASATDYPQKAFEAKTKNAALRALFGTDQVEPSNDVQILRSRVGYLRLRIGPEKPERVAILVTRRYKGYAPHGLINPTDETPLVAVFDLTERIRPHIELDLQLALPSRIDVVVQVRGKLYGAYREDNFYYRSRGDWESHGWAIPECPKVLPPKALPPSWPEVRRASVVNAETVSGGGMTQLEVKFRHPMLSGWWFNWNTCEQLPKFLVQSLQIRRGDQRIGDIWMGPGMGGRLEVMLSGPKPGDRLSLSWRDTAGNSYRALHTITHNSPKNYTALMYAAMRNDPEWARRTLKEGADPNFRDSEVELTALLTAAQSGSTEVARLLIEHGAAIEARATYGQTPLEWAAEHGHLETVRLLLAKGANPNTRSWGYGSASGNTPLTAALRVPGDAFPAAHEQLSRHRDEIVRLLIEAGADVNAKAKDGKTPLKLAREHRFVQAEALLRKAGARD